MQKNIESFLRSFLVTLLPILCAGTILANGSKLINFPGLSDQIPTMILGILAANGWYLWIKDNELNLKVKATQAKILNAKQEIIGRLSADGFLQFSTQEEMYEYIVDRKSTIKKSIDLTYFGNSRRYGREIYDKFESIYYNNLDEIIREGDVKVRRVIIVRDQKMLDWANKLLKDFNKKNFNLGCYVGDSLTPYPLSVMIIDGEEVLMTFSESRTINNDKFISTTSTIFIDLIQNYFDCLFRDSFIVKDKDINEDNHSKFDKACQSKDWAEKQILNESQQ